MRIKQLSVFIENKAGCLHGICKLLAENGINILSLSLADTEQFGVLRLIVKDYEKAKEILVQQGFVAKINDVIAIEIEDHPGSLDSVLGVEEASNVSIEYLYTFVIKSGENAIMLFRFDDMDKAVDAIQKAGLSVLNSLEFYERAEG